MYDSPPNSETPRGAARLGGKAPRAGRKASAAFSSRRATVSATGGSGVADFAKWMAVGFVGGLGAIGVLEGGTWLYDRASTPDEQDQSAASAPRDQGPKGAAEASVRPSVTAEQQPGAGQAEADTKEKAVAKAETALIDRARQALQAGKAGQAVELLERYNREFEDGELSLEADYLRMEAYFQAGDDAMARVMAKQILATRPTGPHGIRARAIIGATGP
jgi:TolA-binding protein